MEMVGSEAHVAYLVKRATFCLSRETCLVTLPTNFRKFHHDFALQGSLLKATEMGVSGQLKNNRGLSF